MSCQVDNYALKAVLTLKGLSVSDNGRRVICSAENTAGGSEASVLLNILCEPSIVALYSCDAHV